MWSEVLQFYTFTYLVLSMIGWINFLNLKIGKAYSYQENISSYIAIVLVAFSVIYPVFLTVFYKKKLDKIYKGKKFKEEIEKFHDRYSMILQKINLNVLRSDVIKTIFLFFLHYFLVIVTVLFSSNATFQINFLSAYLLYYTACIIQLQWDDKVKQVQVVTNLLFELALLYQMFLLTDYNPNYTSGNRVNLIFNSIVVVNLLIVLSESLHNLLRHVRRTDKRIRYRAKKRRQ